MKSLFRRPSPFALAALLTVVPMIGAPLAAQTASVGGSWELSLPTPRGEQTFDVTLEQTDATFTGVADGPMGEMPVTDGVIEGDSITFVIAMTRGRPGGGGGGGGAQSVEQTFRGVLTDAGIEGEVEMPAMGGRGGGGGGGARAGGGGPGQGPRTFTMVRAGG